MPPPPPTFVRSRRLFLRLLGLVYLIAFASLGVQIGGLAGEDGILPLGELLPRALDVLGAGAYWRLPTLAWISPSATFLEALCWGGAAAALLLVAKVAPALAAFLLWLLYLSVTVAGQIFLQFQWDGLLLETGLLAVLYAPARLRPGPPEEDEPPRVVRWVLWLLAFKLTFLSGITKLVSGDEAWATLTALSYHYETQPIPAWTSWFAHQLPAAFHAASAGVMFFIELVVPFAILLPTRFRRTRTAAATLMILLQLGIGATGNYGFFNLLAIVLYLALLDDQTLGSPIQRGFRISTLAPREAERTATLWHAVRQGRLKAAPTIHVESPAAGLPPSRFALRRASPKRSGGGKAYTGPPYDGRRSVAPRSLAAALAVSIGLLSVLTLVREIEETRRRRPLEMGWAGEALSWVAPLRSVNGYGLFRVMTTERPEIVVEVSADGQTWREWDFRWKAGDVNRRPRFVQPHMPRVDWQMWFAALDPWGAQFWLQRLVERLLTGNPDVVALLGPNPLGARPRYARLALYQYHFTTTAERGETGTWWKREFVEYLTGAIAAPTPQD